jgi:hypothetical protein
MIADVHDTPDMVDGAQHRRRLGKAAEQRNQRQQVQREQGMAQTAPTVLDRVAHRLLAQFDRFLPLVRQGMQTASWYYSGTYS